MEPDEKKCPFCAEWIKAEAIKCKHCLSMLESETASETVPQKQGEETLPEDLSSTPSELVAYTDVESEAGAHNSDEAGSARTTPSEPKGWQTPNFKKAMYITAGAVIITILIFLAVYGVRALLVMSYIAIGLIVVGVLVAAVSASSSGTGSTIQGGRCKYCGKQLTGQDLVDHIHEEHEEQYQLDLSKPITGVGSTRTSYSNPAQSFGHSSMRRVCPTCGSIRVARFSRTWKVTKIASVGVLGLGNVHKIFKCKDCGYKW